MKLNNRKSIYEIFDIFASIDIKKYKNTNYIKGYNNFIGSYNDYKKYDNIDAPFSDNIKNINIKKVEHFFTKEIPVIIKYIVNIINSNLASKNYTNNELSKYVINEMHCIIRTLFPTKEQQDIAKDTFLDYSNTLKKDNTYNIFYLSNTSLLLWSELIQEDYSPTIAFTYAVSPVSKGLLNTSIFFTKEFAKNFTAYKPIIEAFSMEYFLHTLTHELFHVITYVEDEAYQIKPLVNLPTSEYKPNEIVKKMNIYDIKEIKYMVDKKNYNPNNAADIYTTIIFAFALLLHNERLIDLSMY